MEKKLHYINKKHIKRETNNAICMELSLGFTGGVDGVNVWFPKKLVCEFIDGITGVEYYVIPDWLYKNKIGVVIDD
ncbi:MAG: hypothetical protein GF317_04935 [Candidatus Lokiarchaeota archaeon]|nr:hypothetical protein [Candidatus Lokiarchaeota archaeon]